MPTGALLQQGGVAVANRTPGFSKLVTFQVDAGTQVGGQAYAGGGSLPVWIAQGAPPSFASLAAYPDSRVTIGTETSVMVGMPSDNKFYPVGFTNYNVDDTGGAGRLRTDTFPFNNLIHSNQSGGTATGGSIVSWSMAMIPAAATDINAFGNFWVPSDFEYLTWAAQSLPSAQGYTVRVRSCMELCISHNSSIYRPFVTPPAPSEPLAIAAVRDVYREMPPAMPKEESSPSWWARLTGAASGAANLVAQLGIPVLSPAAAVAGQFAKLLKI